jgi:hypothetical protein
MSGLTTSPPADLLDSFFDAIPDPLLEQLREATVNVRFERLKELIQSVAGHSPEAAQQLQQLADNFQYEALLATLDYQVEG